MKKSVLILSTVLAFSGVQTFAETVVADTDGNGSFSMDEMVAAYADLTEEAFKAVDTDANGEVSAEELAAAKAAGTIAQ